MRNCRPHTRVMGKAQIAVALVVGLLALGRIAVFGVPKDVLDQGLPDTTIVSGNLFRRLIVADDPENATGCEYDIMQRYKCSEVGCEDLVAGYINYIEFQQCIVSNSSAQIASGILLVFWMMFLLHLVETTTDEYFVTSLQLTVAALKLSPNVAGVTFLAVGNAACDVIASIAAFATGSPKVGVGTTIGAGIFVTTAVVAAVSFVADVRLARRSFIRDVLFFVIIVVYLLYTTLDGIITLGESLGFLAIYLIFVLVVAGGRCLRMLKTEDEGHSFGGSTGKEGAGALAREASKLLVLEGSYQAPGSSGSSPSPSAADADRAARKSNILSLLDVARKEALNKQHDKEIESLKHAKYFAQDEEGGDGGEDEGDGDLGGGSGDGSAAIMASPREEDTLLAASRAQVRRAGSFTEDLPTKPSNWTSAFAATQGLDPSKHYMPFQMPKYHRRKLAKKLAKRLAARGINHEVTMPDGKRIDISELALTDPEGAAELIANAAAAITAEAVQHGGAPLSFQAAKDAATQAKAFVRPKGDSVGNEGDAASGGAPGSLGTTSVAVPVEDLLAVLPKETIKPVSKMYVRFKRVFGTIGPYYSGLMHTMEVPVTIARHLTIPLLHEGSYRRRLVAFNLPFSFALFTIVLTTHILKGTATEVGGFPLWALAALAGLCLSIPLFVWGLPRKGGRGRKNSGTALLASGAQDAGADSNSSSSSSHGSSGHGSSGHGSEKKHWYSPLLLWLLGPTDEPLPSGIVFAMYLVISFVLGLFWLLLIANELVGTALCFGKILGVPDTVMGLAVLAVGNSINDLAASVTIARQGYPSMAVAGAYAGPMFNVVGGIGLPMLIYTSKDPNHQYDIGQDTPIVWAGFVTLLTSLVVTLIWVPLSGFRITHRIGRFLMAWFIGFMLLVIIMGSIPDLAGENTPLG